MCQPYPIVERIANKLLEGISKDKKLNNILTEYKKQGMTIFLAKISPKTIVMVANYTSLVSYHGIIFVKIE